MCRVFMIQHTDKNSKYILVMPRVLNQLHISSIFDSHEDLDVTHQQSYLLLLVLHCPVQFVCHLPARS